MKARTSLIGGAGCFFFAWHKQRTFFRAAKEAKPPGEIVNGRFPPDPLFICLYVERGCIRGGSGCEGFF